MSNSPQAVLRALQFPAYSHNSIKDVRPGSTFELFVPKTDSQRQAFEAAKKIAESIVRNADSYASGMSPLASAKLLMLDGPPGVGKSHLIEAIINYVATHAPQACGAIYLSRYNFTHEHLSDGYDYEHKPIVFLDDLYVEHVDPRRMHIATDLRAMSSWIKTLYEKRVLCVMSSNFSMTQHVFPRVAQADTIGRIASRVAELLKTAGEIHVDGPDHRASAEAPADPFSF